MKRVLCILILLSLVILSFSSCNNASDGFINETEGEIGTKVEVEAKPNIRNSAEMQYLYFEDLLGDVTDVIEGNFVSLTEEGGVYYYEFNDVKSLRGKGTDSTIMVQSVPADYSIIGTDIQFSTYDIDYESGRSYLLLLSRHSSVYTEGEVFSFVNDSLIIPLDTFSSSFSTLKEMSLYGRALSNQFKNHDTNLAVEQGNMKEFVLEKIQGNPLSNENDYIISTNVSDILAMSEYVLVVKIDELFMESYTKDRITYCCSVEEVIKGLLNKQDIKITFPIDEVEIGNSYIVAVNELQGTGANYFVMSSKNSIYDLNQYESIINIVD